MVTTTTKTLNYSIIRGNHTNSVNATITSTPGFNINYFGKIPGILKIVELVILIVTIGLAASRRRANYARRPIDTGNPGWLMEYFLTGEVFFLCVQTVGLVWVTAVLVTYAIHIVSSVIVPKTTIHECVFNFMMVLIFWTAGIVELAETVSNGWGTRMNMEQGDWGCRIAAGALSLFNGTFFLVSFALAVKELQGPKRSAPISASPISNR